MMYELRCAILEKIILVILKEMMYDFAVKEIQRNCFLLLKNKSYFVTS